MKAREFYQQYFADASPEVMSKVRNLIMLSKTQDDIKSKTDSIKKEILPAVKDIGVIEDQDRAVIYVDGSEGLTINRNAIKEVLMRKMKMSEMAAEAILAEASHKRIIPPYIKIMSKQNFAKIKSMLESTKKGKTAQPTEATAIPATQEATNE